MLIFDSPKIMHGTLLYSRKIVPISGKVSTTPTIGTNLMVFTGYFPSISASMTSTQASRTSEMIGTQVWLPEPAFSTTTMKARG